MSNSMHYCAGLSYGMTNCNIFFIFNFFRKSMAI